jgi:hypothetical protein
MAPLVALIPARSSIKSLNQRQESAPVSIHGSGSLDAPTIALKTRRISE